MSFNPVIFHSWTGYKLLSLANQALLIVSIYALVRSFCSRFAIKQMTGFSFALVGLITVAHLPGTSQGLYWMAGYLNYTFPLSLLCLLAALLVGNYEYETPKAKHWLLLPLSLLSILIVGSNETLLFQLCMFWLFMTAVHLNKRGREFWHYFILLWASGLSGLVVVLAPGNGVRRSHFERPNELVTGLKSIGSAIEHIVQFMSLPLAAGIFLTAFITLRTKPAKLKLNLNGRKILLFYFVFLILGFLPSMLSMGGNPRSRVDNMFYLEYVVAILLATFVSASLYPEKWTLRFEKYKWMRPKFMLPLLIASSLLWDNHVLAWYDLIFKSGSYYQTTQSWVTAFDSAGPEDTVKIQALSEIPQTIYFKGPSSESRGNQDMADTLGVGTIVVESH